MAIAAARSIRTSLGSEFPVRAVAVLGDDFGMTDRAVHLGCHGAARARIGGRPAGVTLDAGLLKVPRVRQFILIHEQRYGVSAARGLQLRIGVAGNAIPVRHDLRITNTSPLA